MEERLKGVEEKRAEQKENENILNGGEPFFLREGCIVSGQEV